MGIDGKLLGRLDSNKEQPLRRQERLGQQPQTAQRTEGSQRGKPPPVPPRPREQTVNDNINPENQRPAHQQQQQQKTTTYATVLQTANDGNGGWNLVQDKITARRERERNQLTTPTQNTPMDKRRMVFLWDQTLPPACRTGEDYQSEINRALLKAGAPHWIRIREVKRNDKGTITGMSTEMGTVDNLRKYEAVVIKAARIVDRGIIGFEENEAWQRLKIHGVPLNRYVRRGTNGLEKLREEIQAENAGVTIPMAARWLGRVPQLKER
jgi:hypothetical protein